MRLSSRIFQQYHQFTLVDYLAARFTYFSKDQWSEKIGQELVLVNEQVATPETKLKKDDFVSYYLEDFVEPEADLTYKVIFEDEWIVGINKPGNLLVHKAGKSITHNLVYLLRHTSQNPAYEHIHSVNRLDRETSGIVLFAKDPETLKKLHKDFAASHLAKEYYALVHNIPENPSGVIDLPIGQDTKSSIPSKYSVHGKDEKKAVTRYRLLSSSNEYSLLQVTPVTGRTHQIRVHCASLGVPVAGDKLYGMTETEYISWRENPELYKEKLMFKRQALHCFSVTFMHPTTKQEVTMNAEMPEDMKKWVDELGLEIEEKL
jgi:RluA family pseudouridine synthase